MKSFAILALVLPFLVAGCASVDAANQTSAKPQCDKSAPTGSTIPRKDNC